MARWERTLCGRRSRVRRGGPLEQRTRARQVAAERLTQVTDGMQGVITVLPHGPIVAGRCWNFNQRRLDADAPPRRPGPLAGFMAFMGVGSVVGGLLALRFQPAHPLRVGLLAVWLLSLPSLALAAAWPLWPVAAAALLAGGGTAVFNVFWETALQRNVPSDVLSRVSSYDWFGSFALQPVGQAIVGPVSAALGAPLTLLASGAGIAVTILLTLALPSVRNLGAAGSSPPSPPPARREAGD